MLLFFCICINFTNSSAKNLKVGDDNKIHPYNKLISKIYPRPFPLRFPNVPRILPKQSLYLWQQGKAFFVHVGTDGGDVLGGMHIYENKVGSINLNKLFSFAKNKFIILYCH